MILDAAIEVGALQTAGAAEVLKLAEVNALEVDVQFVNTLALYVVDAKRPDKASEVVAVVTDVYVAAAEVLYSTV